MGLTPENPNEEIEVLPTPAENALGSPFCKRLVLLKILVDLKRYVDNPVVELELDVVWQFR